MSGRNKVIPIGNLGADPEVRHLQTKARRWPTSASPPAGPTRPPDRRESAQTESGTTWWPGAGWRRSPEKYLRKGQQGVRGRQLLRTRQWQDRDGSNRYTTEVVADE